MKRSAGAPARQYLWTSHRIEKSGASVQLFCRAEGFPIPTTTWLDNKDEPISPEDPRYEVSLSHFYIFALTPYTIFQLTRLNNMSRCHIMSCRYGYQVTRFCDTTTHIKILTSDNISIIVHCTLRNALLMIYIICSLNLYYFQFYRFYQMEIY